VLKKKIFTTRGYSGIVEKAMAFPFTPMGATDKPVFGFTRGCVGLFNPITGNPRRLGLSVAPTLFKILSFFNNPTPGSAHLSPADAGAAVAVMRAAPISQAR